MVKVFENVNDGRNLYKMETYFPFEIEPEVEPIASNYAEMISSIILQTPDPRLLPDNDE